MKINKTLLALALVGVFVFSPIVSHAFWIMDASVVEVQRYSTQANLVVNNGGGNFTAQIATANENQIIAIALTAASLNAKVHVSIESGVILGIRMVSP
jgi:Na+/melibiose symporter-like transporter